MLCILGGDGSSTTLHDDTRALAKVCGRTPERTLGEQVVTATIGCAYFGSCIDCFDGQASVSTDVELHLGGGAIVYGESSAGESTEDSRIEGSGG